MPIYVMKGDVKYLSTYKLMDQMVPTGLENHGNPGKLISEFFIILKHHGKLGGGTFFSIFCDYHVK